MVANGRWRRITEVAPATSVSAIWQLGMRLRRQRPNTPIFLVF